MNRKPRAQASAECRSLRLKPTPSRDGGVSKLPGVLPEHLTLVKAFDRHRTTMQSPFENKPERTASTAGFLWVLIFQQGHVVYARRGMARESLETFLATFLGSSDVALSLRLDPDVSSELGTNTVGENKVQVPVDHGHMWTEPLVHAVEHVAQDTKNKVAKILDRCRRAMGNPTGR